MKSQLCSIFLLPILIAVWLILPGPAYAEEGNAYQNVQTKWPQDIDIPGTLSLPELEVFSRGRTQPAERPQETERGSPDIHRNAECSSCSTLPLSRSEDLSAHPDLLF